MSVLKGLIRELEIFRKYMDSSFDGNYAEFRDIQRSKQVSKSSDGHVSNLDLNDLNLTDGERVLKAYSNMVSSSNPKFILSRLNLFLEIIKERTTDAYGALEIVFSDIKKWDSQIYTGEKSPLYKWSYQMSIVDGKRQYVIELRTSQRLIMSIDIKTTLKGRFLSFCAKYHTGISKIEVEAIGGLKGFGFGTKIINIDCQQVGLNRVVTEVYNLDLLDGNEYSRDELINNLISSSVFPLTSFSEYKAESGKGRK